jgi:hypothetical protein
MIANVIVTRDPVGFLFQLSCVCRYIAEHDGGVSFLSKYEGVDYGYDKFIETVGVCVMGRKTFEQVCVQCASWNHMPQSCSGCRLNVESCAWHLSAILCNVFDPSFPRRWSTFRGPGHTLTNGPLCLHHKVRKPMSVGIHGPKMVPRVYACGVLMSSVAGGG